MNPHGDFSAGGSSSGSGAGTAAYETMVSVGSETAGSLIVPASWNGVVGMYPGKGVVDGSQVIPLITNNDSAGPIGRNVVNNYHSQVYATANYPAISVPMGLSANGMPVGVVLIGKPGEEATLLSYAYALEQATKLRVDPDLKLLRTDMTHQNERQSDTAKPQVVTDLEAAYGAPSRAGFGSAVFYEPWLADGDLEQAALAKYKYFVGDLWERYGEEAWMGPWKQVYTRQAGAKPDIVAELRGIADRDARQSVTMILDDVDDAEHARAALAAAFDDPAVTELAAYTLGDGAAMAGILVAGRRDDGAGMFLVFLLD